jgi:hypothetical protein
MLIHAAATKRVGEHRIVVRPYRTVVILVRFGIYRANSEQSMLPSCQQSKSRELAARAGFTAAKCTHARVTRDAAVDLRGRAVASVGNELAGGHGQRGSAGAVTVCFAAGRAGSGRQQMKLILGVAALLIAVVIFLRMRSRAPLTQQSKEPDPSATQRLKADFHAVSIRPGVFACKAARNLEGERFLSGSAPRIPLPDCDASDCTCRFAHHADRRDGEERRMLYRSSLGLHPGALGDDQRGEKDRRDNGSEPE